MEESEKGKGISLRGSEIIILNDGSNNRGNDGSVPASGTNKVRDIAFKSPMAEESKL
ncbi:MAG: hypothetical protein ABJB85_11085 [Nitrososphaerota archaeon]